MIGQAPRRSIPDASWTLLRLDVVVAITAYMFNILFFILGACCSVHGMGGDLFACCEIFALLLLYIC